MPVSEIEGWVEYFSDYPLKIVREYEQTAIIAQTIANSSLALQAQAARKKTFKPVKMEKFLPDFLLEKRSKEASVEQQHSEWGAFVADAKAKLGIT